MPNDHVAEPFREKCDTCNGSGEIAYSVYTGRLRGPGPVPDDARGVRGARCDDCYGAGYIEFEPDPFTDETKSNADA